MIKLKLRDIGKFLASSAVIYTSIFLDRLFIAHQVCAFYHTNGSLKNAFYLSENHCEDYRHATLNNAKNELISQSFFTVGAYKLVDSVFEFKSVHVEAGVSTLVGAGSEVIKTLFKNEISISKIYDNLHTAFFLVSMTCKAIAAGTLAYINHDYSGDPVDN